MRDPIDPADIRVGDRVERVYVSGDHETIERFTVTDAYDGAVLACGGAIGWSTTAPSFGTAEWFLLDRPDPLAEVVGEAARVLWRYYEGEADPEPDSEYSMAYRSAARTIVAAIAERWELVEKNG